MNRHILIFGGTGYFGKHLVNRLLANGDRVCLSTRGHQPIAAGCAFIPFDRDGNDVLHTQQYWDVIYDQSAYQPSHLVSIAPVMGQCGTYVFTSSQAVYPAGLSLVEELNSDADAQINGYGLAKRQAERLVPCYAQRYILPRFPVVVGENDRHARLQKLMANIYSGCMVLPKSNPRLQLIDEHDTADILFELPLHDFQGAINIASPDSLSVYQLCTTIAEHLSVHLSIEWLESYPHEPFDLIKATDKTLHLQKQQQLGLQVKSMQALLRQHCDAFLHTQRRKASPCRTTRV